MSRKSLSQMADVSERYLAQLEAGEGNASIVLLRRVAAALGLGIVELLELDERRPERLAIRRVLESVPESRLEDALSLLTREFGHEDGVRRRRIALIGLRGAGKSTLGAMLAEHLRRPFVELDREIEREAGIGLSEVFLLYGQPGYRRIERRCLDRIIKSHQEIVLSVGGGIVSETETFELLLANCYTVWVRATPEEHMSRVVAQGDMRPMAGHAEAMDDLRHILSSREELYARADMMLDTSAQSVDHSFNELVQLVSTGARPRT